MLVIPRSMQTTLVASAALGLCFGFFIHKGAVYIPSVIINQFLFTQFAMVKMFLSAVATSSLVCFAFTRVPSLKTFASNVREADLSSPTSIPATLLGGALLGSGMALSGACPGTMFVQFGSGTGGALFVLFGGLIGGLIFGLFYEDNRGFFEAPLPEWMHVNRSFDRLWGTSWSTLALKTAAVSSAVVLLLELIVPYHYDIGMSPEDIGSAKSVLTRVVWPPHAAGILVGLLQAPALFFVHDMLGSSQSIITFLAIVLPKDFSSDYFKSYKSGKSNLWQLTYIGFAIIGAFISSLLSTSFASYASPRSFVFSMIGGFLIIFGARMAGGCTSGHGISGIAQGNIRSYMAVGTMFGAGIVTAIVMKAVEFLVM